jgi:hypothetical protein
MQENHGTATGSAMTLRQEHGKQRALVNFGNLHAFICPQRFSASRQRQERPGLDLIAGESRLIGTWEERGQHHQDE